MGDDVKGGHQFLGSGNPFCQIRYYGGAVWCGVRFHYRLSSKLDLGLVHLVYNMNLSSTFKALNISLETVAFNICFDWVAACVKLFITSKRDCRGKGNPISATLSIPGVVSELHTTCGTFSTYTCTMLVTLY